MINFELARICAIEGAVNYIADQPVVGDRYGQYHGRMGMKRAHNLGVLLSQLGEDSQYKNANILAILLAVFNYPPIDNSLIGNLFSNWPFKNIGRSSKLVSFIADQWIQGNVSYNLTPPGSVTSPVFSPNALSHVVGNSNNNRVVPNGEASWMYFDKTKGAREILNIVLNSPQFQNEKNSIIESLSKLRDYLECNEEDILSQGRMLLPYPVNDQAPLPLAMRRL